MKFQRLACALVLMWISGQLVAQEPVNSPAPSSAPADTAELGTDVVIFDPWERYNRGMHRFNRGLDKALTKPLAKAYQKITPRPLRTGIRNFFINIFQPISALHLLLQGRPGAAGATLGRFAINLSLGLGGLFDPASDANIPLRREDFGQTMAVWGWQRSRYFELPLLGPSTLRDAFGFAGDYPLSPLQLANTPERYYVTGLNVINLRAGFLDDESLIKDSGDEYRLLRSAFLQKRDFDIHDRTARDQLPDYLQDDGALEEAP